MDEWSAQKMTSNAVRQNHFAMLLIRHDSSDVAIMPCDLHYERSNERCGAKQYVVEKSRKSPR